jgi:SAM-dependent methyltransferase
VEWIEADMREFQHPAGFDLICSLYASFGYFDDRQNQRVLENVRASLAPGGTLLLDLVGREAAVRHWQERRWQEVEGVLYLERCTFTEDSKFLASGWIVVREGKRLDFQAKQRMYSAGELRDLLLSVGFEDVQLAGSLDARTPYDESARRLVAVGRLATGG